VFSDKRLNLLNGMTVKGNTMSMSALSLNASMAAAFIHCTDLEAGIDDKDTKQKLQKDISLLQVVKDMITESVHQHGKRVKDSDFTQEVIDGYMAKLDEFSNMLIVHPVHLKPVESEFDNRMDAFWNSGEKKPRKLLNIEKVKKPDDVIAKKNTGMNGDKAIVQVTTNNADNAFTIIDTMSGDSGYAKKFQAQKIHDNITEFEEYKKIIEDSNIIALSVEDAIQKKREKIASKFESEFEKFKETVDFQTDQMIITLKEQIEDKIFKLHNDDDDDVVVGDHANVDVTINNIADNMDTSNDALNESGTDMAIDADEGQNTNDDVDNDANANDNINTSDSHEVDVTADPLDTSEMDTAVDTTGDDVNASDFQETDTTIDAADDDVNASDFHDMDTTVDTADEDVNVSDFHEMDTTTDVYEDDITQTTTEISNIVTSRRKIYQPGDTVTVIPRTWPGINKPGGAAYITCRNDADDTYDVRYIITSSRDKNVPAEYIEDLYQKINNDDFEGDVDVADSEDIRISINHDHINHNESVLRRLPQTHAPISVEPLQGWALGSMGPDIPWRDNRFCCLCRESVEDNICGNTNTTYCNLILILILILILLLLTGRLLQLSSSECVHVNCIRFSHGVHETSGKLKNVVNTITATAAQGYKRICVICKGRGASVKCSRKGCGTFYHLKCALSVKCLLYECVHTSHASDTSGLGLGKQLLYNIIIVIIIIIIIIIIILINYYR